jgi:prophage regulatory protein
MTSPSEKLLRISDLCKWLNVSKSTIYKWVREGRFPKPILLGDNASRWRESLVVEWLDSRPTSND